MHKIKVELVGAVSASQEVELDDRDALPKYVEVLGALVPDGVEPTKKTRRGRKPKVAEQTTADPNAESADADDTNDEMFADAS